MAYEQCPKCGTKKHQVNKCPNCGFSRKQYERAFHENHDMSYEQSPKYEETKKKNNKFQKYESSLSRRRNQEFVNCPICLARLSSSNLDRHMRKKHGKEAIRRKAKALYTGDLLVYGELKEDKTTHEAYQFKIQSLDYGWNPEKSICPVCGGDGGVNEQCYKCGGSGWA